MRPCSRSRARAAALVTAAVLGVATGRLDAQSPPDRAGITTPKAQFGFDIGDDYQLANYTQLADVLAEARRRVGSHDGWSTSARPRKAGRS